MTFEVNFHTDVEKEAVDLKSYAVKKLSDISTKYKSLLNASVNLVTEIKGTTPHLFKSTITISTKLKKFSAIKKGEIAHIALKESLESVERQIRKTLDKINHPWELPHKKQG